MSLDNLSAEQLEQELLVVAAGLQSAGRQAIVEMQTVVHQGALDRVPVKSGRARRSIASGPGRKPVFSAGDSPGAQPVALEKLFSGTVSSGARRPDGFPYAQSLERRKPFFGPAVEDLDRQADQIIQKQFTAVMGPPE